MRQKRPPVRRHGKNSGSSFFFMVCLGVLGAVLVIRLFDPAGLELLRKSVYKSIDGTGRIQSAFNSFGRAVESGENILTAFRLSFLSPESPPSVTPEETVSPSPEATVTPSYSPLSSEAAARPLSDSFTTPTPTEVPDTTMYLPESGNSLSYEDTDDDTLPLPFDMPLPDKADYTEYQLPFSFSSPHAAGISSDFGYRSHPIDGEYKFHYGVDFAGSSGSDIHAFADGKVIIAAYDASYGNYIVLEHEDGYRTLYGHCSKLLKKEGAVVSEGEVIARIGATGAVTGPHLHFELRRDNMLLDPMYYIENAIIRN